MSALGGGGGPPKADDSTDKLRECDSDKGEKVKQPKILKMPPYVFWGRVDLKPSF